MSVEPRAVIRLGISTCPNDTFAFHALMTRQIDWRGIDFQIELLDIQQLNDRLMSGDFDVAKASFHAALLLAQRYVVLPSGSALGFGVGPLLLAADGPEPPQHSGQIALCPGQHTTAALLFRLFHADTASVRHVVFSQIMPLLQQGQADFGVCIHEGRFTWQEQGLELVEDLGTRWEQATDCPLPLGGIIARRDLPDETLADVQAAIRDSLRYALTDRAAPLPTMRHYAQEFDDDVLMSHVNLYVNRWTEELGPTGRQALAELAAQARRVGLLASETELEVFG